MATYILIDDLARVVGKVTRSDNKTARRYKDTIVEYGQRATNGDWHVKGRARVRTISDYNRRVSSGYLDTNNLAEWEV
jgi:hypothetical protein